MHTANFTYEKWRAQSTSKQNTSLDENSLFIQIVLLRTSNEFRNCEFLYNWNMWHTINFAKNKIQTRNDVETNDWIHCFVFVSLIKLQDKSLTKRSKLYVIMYFKQYDFINYNIDFLSSFSQWMCKLKKQK